MSLLPCTLATARRIADASSSTCARCGHEHEHLRGVLVTHRVVEHDLGGAQERHAVGCEEVDAPAQGGEDDVGHSAGQETCEGCAQPCEGMAVRADGIPARGTCRSTALYSLLEAMRTHRRRWSMSAA